MSYAERRHTFDSISSGELPLGDAILSRDIHNDF